MITILSVLYDCNNGHGISVGNGISSVSTEYIAFCAQWISYHKFSNYYRLNNRLWPSLTVSNNNISL